MATPDLHPIARDVLAAFAPHDYFRSNRLAKSLAERDPKQCVEWAIDLVEQRVTASSPHEIAVQTLNAVRDATAAPSAEMLPQLDELAWQSWSSGSFDESSPYLQRAVARLAWATICMICMTTNSTFESQFTGIHAAIADNGLFTEMANQCAMAVDMTHTRTPDGRLLVAATFTREMDTQR